MKKAFKMIVIYFLFSHYQKKKCFYNTHSLNTKLNIKVKVMAVTIAK